MKVFFESIGVLTTYNIDLPNALCRNCKVDMSVDAEGNLSRFMLLRARLLKNYKPNLKFVSCVAKAVPEKRLAGYFNRFDLLHLNSASPFGIKLMELSKKPKLFVLHQAPLSELFYKQVSSHVDLFVAPSEFTAEGETEKIGFKPLVIHHGVNTEIFNTSLSVLAARKTLGLPLNAKIVLWNDRFSVEKDLHTFLEAIPLITKEVPNVYFFIKGRAVDKTYFNKIKGSFEKINKQPNVRCHIGWFSHEKLPVLYRAADLFVRTSLHENFGLALVESMACGTPVLGSKCATIPEVLGDAGLFFEPSNPKDLAEQTTHFFSTTDKKKGLATRSLQRVKENFTYAKVAEKYQVVYENLRVPFSS